MASRQIGNSEAAQCELLRYRHLRNEMVSFCDRLGFQFFVTLAANRTGDYWKARHLFGGWMARVDREISGRSWWKHADRRSLAIATIEHADSNLHLHVMLRLPRHVSGLPYADKREHRNWKLAASRWEPRLEAHWTEICPGGDVKALPFKEGASSYTLKKANQRDNFEQWMISSEFHSGSCK